MNWMKFLLTILFISDSCCREVSDDEYSRLPLLFHYDNFDKCMEMGDRALYCSFSYKLKPMHPQKAPAVWNTIKELRGNQFSYHHDDLRHWICIPKTCSEIRINDKNVSMDSEINRCYNKKFENMGLTGIITELECQTNQPRHPIDFIDIIVGLLMVTYILFVIHISLRKAAKDQNGTPTLKQKILMSFSIPQNWEHLKTVKNTPEVEQFRVFQGVRFYNSVIVIFSHSLLFTILGPTANPRFAENMHSRLTTSFLTAGPLCVGTNFFLASFFLTYGVYCRSEYHKFTIKSALSMFVNRCLRLYPALLLRILLAITWSRHFGNGPVWNFYNEHDFKCCRKNGWINLLFLNTVLEKYNMCLVTTWYLAQDTQFYLLAILFLWLSLKYPKLLWPLLSITLTLCISGVVHENYLPDHKAIFSPRIEDLYKSRFSKLPEWHIKSISYYGNLIPTLLGIGFGYIFYLDRDKSIFKKYKKNLINYQMFFILPALFVGLLPGFLLLILQVKHHRIWASLYLATSRLIFHCSLGILFYAVSRGIKGVFGKCLEWSPTYILGRLSYSAYLIHDVLMKTRVGLARSPAYLNDFLFFMNYLADLTATYIFALLITLFIELPVSRLLKILRRDELERGKEKNK